MRACLASIAALLCLILPEKGDACRRRCVRQVCAPAPLRLPKEAIAPRDFALIPALGGPETYFATMAEAVAAARDRDVVEVRGNGPYIASGLIIKGKELTIRAGEGYDPVIRPRPEDVRTGKTYLFITDSPIHVRGLTLDGVGLRF
ncbi:MAG: hypothetical protein U0793_14425 [Gemmataceae bacterium]